MPFNIVLFLAVKRARGQPLVHTGRVYTDQLMHSTLVRFRNHSPVEHITLECRQALTFQTWFMGQYLQTQLVTLGA